MEDRLRSCLGLILVAFVLSESVILAQEGFDDYEIRVIRPRYFSKSGAFELGLDSSVVTNQSFIHTYLVSGVISYHLNEQWAFDLDYSYGFSIDKEDKDNLAINFEVFPKIPRTTHLLTLGILWTPIYGKYQLSSRKVIYFDTFFSAGGGSSGIEYIYDSCPSIQNIPLGSDLRVQDTSELFFYPSFFAGLGQRFFLNKSSSLNWDARIYFMSINSSDSQCQVSSDDTSTFLHQNVIFKLGYSFFL